MGLTFSPSTQVVATIQLGQPCQGYQTPICTHAGPVALLAFSADFLPRGLPTPQVPGCMGLSGATFEDFHIPRPRYFVSRIPSLKGREGNCKHRHCVLQVGPCSLASCAPALGACCPWGGGREGWEPFQDTKAWVQAAGAQAALLCKQQA